MPYALSVFLPESGITQEILTKPEIIDLLKLKTDESISNKPEANSFLMDVVETL